MWAIKKIQNKAVYLLLTFKINFFATKISVVISHRRLTYGELVSLLSTFFLTIQTIESSMYEFSSSFIWLSKNKKNKDDLTVEEVWYTNFLYTDLVVSKKGHNSGIPVPNLTKQMAFTFTFYKVHVYQLLFSYLDNCGKSIRLKKATKRQFVTCFRDVAMELENIVGNTDFQNLT